MVKNGGNFAQKSWVDKLYILLTVTLFFRIRMRRLPWNLLIKNQRVLWKLNQKRQAQQMAPKIMRTMLKIVTLTTSETQKTINNNNIKILYF